MGTLRKNAQQGKVLCSSFLISTMLKVQLVCYLLLLIISVQGIPCAIPCVSKFPTCQISYCDEENGVCVDAPKDPLPQDCCVASSNCITGDPCVIGSCDFLMNQCRFTSVCGQSDSNETNVHAQEIRIVCKMMFAF